MGQRCLLIEPCEGGESPLEDERAPLQEEERPLQRIGACVPTLVTAAQAQRLFTAAGLRTTCAALDKGGDREALLRVRCRAVVLRSSGRRGRGATRPTDGGGSRGIRQRRRSRAQGS